MLLRKVGVVMKIKQKKAEYSQVKDLPRAKRFNPQRPFGLLTFVVRVLAGMKLTKNKFSYTSDYAEILDKGPCLILMNHSSFLDLQIASKILYPRKYNIVCTTDGLVGKKLLMKMLGCIPTRKFVSDMGLIRDIRYALNNGTHVLMYPEAGYSFDGRSTLLPKKLGAFAKILNVPVVTIITQGAFNYQPLFNELNIRKVKTSAHVQCLFTKGQTQKLSVEELSKKIEEAFVFDNFKYQQDNLIKITEKNRADGLHRILYKCPHCLKEGKMVGKGVEIICQECGKSYILNEYGYLVAKSGESKFRHIPDWYDWQREEVRKEILNGEYKLDAPVEIGLLFDYKALYMVGSGRLVHDKNGFSLTGANGELNYTQPVSASYTLNSDFYWYEIGDVIGIGNNDCLYYCFPKDDTIVCKARLATEELYKMNKGGR